MRRWCWWRQKFLSGLFESPFLFQLPQRAQVDEVLELQAFAFASLASLRARFEYRPAVDRNGSGARLGRIITLATVQVGCYIMLSMQRRELWT